MAQLHKKFSDEQVKALLERYLKKRDREKICSGNLGHWQSPVENGVSAHFPFR